MMNPRLKPHGSLLQAEELLTVLVEEMKRGGKTTDRDAGRAELTLLCAMTN